MPKDKQSTKPPATPQTIEAFRERLAQLNGHLPRRLQHCADHCAAHFDTIALSTVAALAKSAGVPPSAMMRFCQAMGFSGYADMQQLFRRSLLLPAPDYATRLANLKAGGVEEPATLVAEFVETGRQSLECLARELNETSLKQAVSLLSTARVVHIVGFRRSFPVAAYLVYVFDKLGVPTVLHDRVGGLGHGASLQTGDALLAITFSPYSDETLDLAARAQSSGLPVVILTDPPDTQLAPFADVVLTVAEIDFGAFRSLSAAIALALSLAVAVAARRG